MHEPVCPQCVTIQNHNLNHISHSCPSYRLPLDMRSSHSSGYEDKVEDFKQFSFLKFISTGFPIHSHQPALSFSLITPTFFSPSGSQAKRQLLSLIMCGLIWAGAQLTSGKCPILTVFYLVCTRNNLKGVSNLWNSLAYLFCRWKESGLANL